MRRRPTILAALLAATSLARPATAEELLPKYVTPPTQKCIKTGLDYLAQAQGPDGNFPGSADGSQYAVVMTSLAGMAFLANGNTPSRGPYAENIRRAAAYVMSQARDNGLICSDPEFQGRSMYGHGFGLLFLSSIYGMETDDRRRASMKKIIENGIKLTSGAQVNGGWTYVPGQGDEGSVTVTQLQALRAANNAGFTVPKGTIEMAIKYLEHCQTPDGGIEYSYGSSSGPLLAISAAALAGMYNAGDYDSKMSDHCLAWVTQQFDRNKGSFNKSSGHDFYTHLYASQAFYQAGDEYWTNYYPQTRDQLIRMQSKDGTWDGDGVGPIYSTSIALTILQLPYKFLPIYQR